MKKHRTVWGIAVAFAAVALLVGGVAKASNMGFKFVPQIGGPGEAAGDCLNLSLPWNNNYTNALSLINDIPGASKVSWLDPGSNFIDWVAGAGGTNFPIAKGEAYVVFSSGPQLTPVIVGSHDPNFTFNFAAGTFFNAAAPYHQTLTNAQGLMNSFNAHCPNAIAKISDVDIGANFIDWVNGAGGTNFTLQLGKGVVIQANTACNGYVWPHY